MKGKYEKDSSRSNEVTPSCKCDVFVDKPALKKLFTRVFWVLGVVHVLSSTTTPPPLK